MNTINTDEYEANNCIRIAYRAFHLEEYLVEFSIANIEPTKGTIAASVKDKFDQMKDSTERPFHEYQCSKYSNNCVASSNTQQGELCRCPVQLLVK